MKTAICTCIKDEQAYLKEWLDYHLNLGFDHIYLYEDNGSISHSDIVKDYDNVTLLPINIASKECVKGGRQMQSIKHSLRTLKGKYDWIAFIDVDEFIRLEENLRDLLNKYSEYDSIYLSWKMFGACGRIDKPEGTVQESYTTPELNVDFNKLIGHQYQHKSIVNVNRNSLIKDNHTVCDGINMNGGKEGKPGIHHTAWIDHYFTKSWKEWCNRIFKRGDLCNGNRKLHLFFKCNPDFNDRKDKMIAEVADIIPIGYKNYWLSNKIIAGGNVRKIKEINTQRRLRDVLFK